MYHLKVLTPEQIIFDDEVLAIIAPGSDGYLGVLTNHAPLMTILKTGHLVITDKNKTKHYYQVSRGFLEVNHNQVYLLADSIEPSPPVNMGGSF